MRTLPSHYDLVIFLPSGAWQMNTRKQMLLAVFRKLRALGRESKVLLVERPVCPFVSPLLHCRDYLRWLAGKRGIRKLENNCFLFTPVVLLHDIIARFLPGLILINRGILRYQLNKVLDRLGLNRENLVAWVYHPYQRYCQGLLSEKLFLYECYDEYKEFERNALMRRVVVDEEKKLVREADLVFATAESLAKSRKALNSNVHFLPNGVDFEHFARILNREPSPLEDLDKLSRPLIGFVGKINENVDYQLLNYLANRHPEWSIVLLGFFDGHRSLLSQRDYVEARQRPNLHFMGWKDYGILPDYVRAFDVCLIPFVLTELMRHVYPLKLHEYLAVGKPVVSTALPTLSPFEDVVRIAGGYAEFEHYIEASLCEEQSRALLEKRVAVARINSWERRAERVIALIDDALGGERKRGQEEKCAHSR